MPLRRLTRMIRRYHFQSPMAHPGRRLPAPLERIAMIKGFKEGDSGVGVGVEG